LDRVVQHATVLINGCDDAGILTVRRGEVVPCSDERRGAPPDRISRTCEKAVLRRRDRRQQIYTIET